MWAACGVPDFAKLGVEPHARFVGQLFRHLSEGDGHVPHGWFAEQVARLDRIDGDVETIAGRIAGIRSWAYIAQRADWLADPAAGAARAGAVEERLSDALHAALTQRFVDKRTSVLLRQIGSDPLALPVVVDVEGEVTVEGHPLGRLEGFRFTPAAGAVAQDKRMLLAAAEKRLTGEYASRGRALGGCAAMTNSPFGLSLSKPRSCPRCKEERHFDRLSANGVGLGRGGGGHAGAGPRSRDAEGQARPRARRADAAGAGGGAGAAGAVAGGAGARDWCRGWQRSPALTRDAEAGAPLRAAAAALLEAGGIVPRRALAREIAALDPAARKRLRAAGTVIGTLDLYDLRLLKPAAAEWRRTLLAVRGVTLGEGAPVGATVLARGSAGADLPHGFRPLGAQAVRVDLVERIARGAHDARQGRQAVRARSGAGDLDRADAGDAGAVDGAIGLQGAAREMGVAGAAAARAGQARRAGQCLCEADGMGGWLRRSACRRCGSTGSCGGRGSPRRASVAQAVAESGSLRIDGRRIERAHCPVRVGDTLTFAARAETELGCGWSASWRCRTGAGRPRKRRRAMRASMPG